MTEYPYTFYVFGSENIQSAEEWCLNKFKSLDSKFIDRRWRFDDFACINESGCTDIGKFDFSDYKIAFEFALIWG